MGENLPIAGKYVDDALKSLFTETIDQLIADLGRPVKLFFEPTASGCPNCVRGFDGSSQGIYNASNPFGAGKYNRAFPNGGVCPVCKGTNSILTENSVTYTANIGRAPKDIDYDALGENPTNIYKTKTQICAYNDILKCEKILIDGVICTRFRDPIKTGLQTLTYVVAWWKKED
jgi:hypothetical protein